MNFISTGKKSVLRYLKLDWRETTLMRLAFIDHVFTWPPVGGAPLDLYHTITHLQKMGHEIELFYGRTPGNPLEQEVNESLLPFNCTAISYCKHDYSIKMLAGSYKKAVDTYQPDVVFQCFSFFVKPYLSLALQAYPQIGRYYAYEPFCPRDFRLFKNGTTCKYNFLENRNICNWCTLRSMWRNILTGYPNPYVHEYLKAAGYSSTYYNLLCSTLNSYSSILVNNQFTKKLLENFNSNIKIAGGGVDLGDFEYSPPCNRQPGEKTVVLMTGRASDPTKGLDILIEAGNILSSRRNDFEVWITDSSIHMDYSWLRQLPWQLSTKIAELYSEADICVIPSIWEEPFGLVALEAMAVGRPVVAANSGGLNDIVIHDKTGYLYDRTSSTALAHHLELLLDNKESRIQMGQAGRTRVEMEYTWDKVMKHSYIKAIDEAIIKSQDAR